MNPAHDSQERDELLQSRCQQCDRVTDKLYRIGSGTGQRLICKDCRSELVGE